MQYDTVGYRHLFDQTISDDSRCMILLTKNPRGILF